MKKVAIIAVNTFKEAVRNRVLYVANADVSYMGEPTGQWLLPGQGYGENCLAAAEESAALMSVNYPPGTNVVKFGNFESRDLSFWSSSQGAVP